MSTIKNPKLILIIIILLGEIGYVATDIYLPSMPDIAATLQGSETLTQLTITLYLFGFGFSQLFYGPLSDTFGRRPTALLGLVITAIASLVCTITHSIHLLLAARLLQGIGTGSGNVLVRAVMRDLFHGTQLARASSFYATTSSFLLAGIPAVGGYIQAYLGWRANFGFTLLYTLMAWVIIWQWLPETNQQRNPTAMQLSQLIKNYGQIVKNKVFIGNALCSSLALSGFTAYITASPFLFENLLGISAIAYGWLGILTAGAFVIGSIINNYFVTRYGMHCMLLAGIYCMLLAAIGLLLPALLGYLTVLLVLLPVLIFFAGTSLVFANSYGKAFTPFAQSAGSAGALYGCIQILVSTLTSGIVAAMPEVDQKNLAWTLLGLSILALILYYLWLKNSSDN